MGKVKLERVHKIHFIGIGGISMSALALICNKWGKVISGSDRQQNDIIQKLKNNGIVVFNQHSEKNINNDVDLVVYTSAINAHNVELIAAKQKCKFVIERAQFLNIVAQQFKNIIAISGTHGKTTTCGMVASIFMCAGLMPTVHNGGLINGMNTNFVIGDNKYFITEACEYKKHLLCLTPTVGAVLNIEKDHMECYKNFKDLKKCFVKFMKKSKVSISNQGLDLKRHINYLELYKPTDIIKQENGCYSFNIKSDNKLIHIQLGIYGKHNIQNALCAVAISKLFLIQDKYIQQGLKQYKGIQRRFETLGKIYKATIIRDYAHHPTEIKATINTLKELNKPYIVIFQPHTYSRTAKLLNEFKQTLSCIDKIYIYKTYPARETKDMGLTAKQLSDSLENTHYIGTLPKLKRIVNKFIDKDVNIVFVGAGDIGDIAKQLI